VGLVPPHGVAGITSERRPASNRKGGRFQIGILAGITSEYLAGRTTKLWPMSPIAGEQLPFSHALLPDLLQVSIFHAMTLAVAGMAIPQEVSEQLLFHAVGLAGRVPELKTAPACTSARQAPA
jgi:hypothetical protein